MCWEFLDKSNDLVDIVRFFSDIHPVYVSVLVARSAFLSSFFRILTGEKSMRLQHCTLRENIDISLCTCLCGRELSSLDSPIVCPNSLCHPDLETNDKRETIWVD